jgi:hypothetical protein
MIQVAKNEFYEFNVDIDKNRLYGTLTGFWKSPTQVPEYLTDLKAALDKLKPGFTILTDLRTMKPPTTDIGHLHMEAQQLVTESGVNKTAEVLGKAILIEMQLRKFGQGTSAIKAEFDTPEEAEAWLDSN